ncbi:hypothetical protein LPTSP3_g30940 [Leptospira kobayashii]|uniref:Uncharacterized protein n=1 Tax=Leptospira kobayashii TaxID=1917830 RepID=A0ABN6KG35_9LEPT|nr:hypothetical protein [Leptospira kobayashii]BDA80164.1 hypothetical protein LPTSP3_g30940 [Leptospira kobayashii]
MPKKLKIDSLNADLSAISNLLKFAESANDKIGQIQYKYRKMELEEKISALESTPTHNASIALYFGGKPVIGSAGISAAFAGKTIHSFQNIISNVYASYSGDRMNDTIKGEKGKLPFLDESKLMVTTITKGSFGFILDEIDNENTLTNTNLSNVVDEVANILVDTSSNEESFFYDVVARINSRTFSAVKEFFVTLEKNSATLRVVEDNKDFYLNEEAIHRAKIRTEASISEEKKIELKGTLIGVLPIHRKFELVLENNGQLIYGGMTSSALKQYMDFEQQGISMKENKIHALCYQKTIESLTAEPKSVYTIYYISLEQPNLLT